MKYKAILTLLLSIGLLSFTETQNDLKEFDRYFTNSYGEILRDFTLTKNEIQIISTSGCAKVTIYREYFEYIEVVPGHNGGVFIGFITNNKNGVVKRCSKYTPPTRSKKAMIGPIVIKDDLKEEIDMLNKLIQND